MFSIRAKLALNRAPSQLLHVFFAVHNLAQVLVNTHGPLSADAEV